MNTSAIFKVSAAVLLAVIASGCSSAHEDPSGRAEAAATDDGTFTLNAGSENLEKCNGLGPVSDRECYLRSLDRTNAYWLGVASKAVYDVMIDEDQPAGAFGAMTTGGLDAAKLAWRERVIFDDSLSRSVAMYFETEGGVAVLAFRGTATSVGKEDLGPGNLVTDARIGKTCAEGKDGARFCIQSGFHDAFQRLWSSDRDIGRSLPSTHCAAGSDSTREGRETRHCAAVPARDKVVVRAEMKAYLTERFKPSTSRPPPHTLFITGHSLGGALATLALNELLLDPSMLPPTTNVAVYTYGTPRVGDAAFAKKVFEVSRARSIPYYRFVHRRELARRIRGLDRCSRLHGGLVAGRFFFGGDLVDAGLCFAAFLGQVVACRRLRRRGQRRRRDGGGNGQRGGRDESG